MKHNFDLYIVKVVDCDCCGKEVTEICNDCEKSICESCHEHIEPDYDALIDELRVSS